MSIKRILISLTVLLASCSYKVPFGAVSSSKSLPPKSDVDTVLDKQVIYPDGNGVAKKGFHLGW